MHQEFVYNQSFGHLNLQHVFTSSSGLACLICRLLLTMCDGRHACNASWKDHACSKVSFKHLIQHDLMGQMRGMEAYENNDKHVLVPGQW